MIHNTLPNSVARIWVGWDPNLFHVRKLHEDEQCITCQITTKTPGPEAFILSVVYGFNKRSRRRELWRSLRYQNAIYGNQPWLIMGDFNIILDSSGKKGNKRIDKYAIKEFNDWILDADVLHILSRGFKFSWSNKRDINNRNILRLTTYFATRNGTINSQITS